MRGPLLILALGIACLAHGQVPQQQVSGAAIRPDVVIYVTAGPLGGDIVRVTMVDAGYPSDLLNKQVADLGTRLGVPAKGLQVYTYQMTSANPKLRYLEAYFSTANLTTEDGYANLTPLIQAFAGAPAPNTIKGMEIFYDDFDPPLKGPKHFSSSAVNIVGRIDMNPPQVEYSVQLLSQNPSEINVETTPANVEPKVNQAPVQTGNPVLVWCLILLAGLAAGALVYFLLIKRLSGGSSTSVIRKP
jgi:hypothetical protein